MGPKRRKILEMEKKTDLKMKSTVVREEVKLRDLEHIKINSVI